MEAKTETEKEKEQKKETEKEKKKKNEKKKDDDKYKGKEEKEKMEKDEQKKNSIKLHICFQQPHWLVRTNDLPKEQVWYDAHRRRFKQELDKTYWELHARVLGRELKSAASKQQDLASRAVWTSQGGIPGKDHS